MRVPLDINEHNFPQENIVYVFGGLLDPENREDFCTQTFPKISAMELLVEQEALSAIQDDDSAELYRIDKNSGIAVRLSNRNKNCSAFPERLARDYFKESGPMLEVLLTVSDLDVLIFNLITASREAGFCRGKNIDDATANEKEDSALRALKKALEDKQG